MSETVGLTLEESERILREYQSDYKSPKLNSNQVALEHAAQLSDDEQLSLVQAMEKVMLRGGSRLKVVGTIARPAVAAVKSAIDHSAVYSAKEPLIVLVLSYGPYAYEATLVCIYPAQGEGKAPRHRILATNAISEAREQRAFQANPAKRGLADAQQMYQRATRLASVASEMLSHAGANKPSRILIVREMSYRASIRHGLVGAFKQYGYENDDFWELDPHDKTLRDAIAKYATSEPIHMLLPGALCTSGVFLGVQSLTSEGDAPKIDWHPLKATTPCELRFDMKVPKGTIVTRYGIYARDSRHLSAPNSQLIGILPLDHERIIEADTKDELRLAIDMWGLVTVTACEHGQQKIAVQRTFSLCEPLTEDSSDLWMPEVQEYRPAPPADTQSIATAAIDQTVQLTATQPLDTNDSGTLERRMSSLVAPVFGIHQNKPRTTLSHAIGIVYVDPLDATRKMRVLASEGSSLPFSSEAFRVQTTSDYGELVLAYAPEPTGGKSVLESEDFRELAHLWNDKVFSRDVFTARVTLESETKFTLELEDADGRRVSLKTVLPADDEG